MSALAAFLITLVLIPLAKSLALRIDLVDKPGGRKQHEDEVPPVGGLIILPVFMVLAVFLSGADLGNYGVFFIALILLLVIGAIDDHASLSAWIKFPMQIFIAFLVVMAGGARVYTLSNMFGFGELGLGFMSVPFSMAAIVLLINAVNLMDGLDGLAAGKSFVALGWLMVACIVGKQPEFVLAMAPLMGALAGFLVYNMRHPFRSRASVFLGDAGSMGLGLTLGWFCIVLTQNPHHVLEPISIAWILALPIIDTCAQFYRRVKEGRHPFSPDRGHFHHHLIHAGIPVAYSTALILMLGFVLGGIGYIGILLGIPQYVLTLAWIALLFAHMGLSLKREVYIHLFSHLR